MSNIIQTVGCGRWTNLIATLVVEGTIGGMIASPDGSVWQESKREVETSARFVSPYTTLERGNQNALGFSRIGKALRETAKSTVVILLVYSMYKT